MIVCWHLYNSNHEHKQYNDNNCKQSLSYGMGIALYNRGTIERGNTALDSFEQRVCEMAAALAATLFHFWESHVAKTTCVYN